MAQPTSRVMGTLSLVVFLRVLGVFLVLVGFVDYWRELGGSTGTSGIAFASYALALAVFLLPLGSLSDRLGRRDVMAGAILVSVVGGLLAAFATTPWLFVAGRFVQGAGAVNGVALAVAGEVGEPERRTRRMALLGAAAGGGVVLGLALSVLLSLLRVTIPQILIAYSLLSLLSLPLVLQHVPHEPSREPQLPDPRRTRIALLLGAGAFAVNFSLSGLLLYSRDLLAAAAPGVPYALALLIMLLPAGLGMFAASRLADAGHAGVVGAGAALLLGFAPLAFLAPVGAVPVLAAGVLFFLGHSSLTSLLPSLASHLAPPRRRGFSQGLQSTLQYLGSAVGTSAMGALFARGATSAMGAAFVAAGVVSGVVVLIAARRAGRRS